MFELEKGVRLPRILLGGIPRGECRVRGAAERTQGQSVAEGGAEGARNKKKTAAKPKHGDYGNDTLQTGNGLRRCKNATDTAATERMPGRRGDREHQPPTANRPTPQKRLNRRRDHRKRKSPRRRRKIAALKQEIYRTNGERSGRAAAGRWCWRMKAFIRGRIFRRTRNGKGQAGRDMQKRPGGKKGMSWRG